MDQMLLILNVIIGRFPRQAVIQGKAQQGKLGDKTNEFNKNRDVNHSDTFEREELNILRGHPCC